MSLQNVYPNSKYSSNIVSVKKHLRFDKLQTALQNKMRIVILKFPFIVKNTKIYTQKINKDFVEFFGRMTFSRKL